MPTQEQNAESWGASIRRRFQITGVVQGVGFRPFIYRLATECRLAGYVLNDTSGVLIEVQGQSPLVEVFGQRIRKEAPALSRIVGFAVADLPIDPRPNGFRILESQAGADQRVLISPDIATCDDCLREVLDPEDRRYHYPFINCTNCGPRFTIVRDIPYDRPLTTMSVFPMCLECEREYHDPANRRFHAQPNACWKCGPKVEFRAEAADEIEDPISAIVQRLRAGRIAAIKGLGGFHLAVDASNAEAVERLRARKHRVEKPFAVMVPDIAAAEGFCEIDEVSRRLLLSPQRPIVLLKKRRDSTIADAVAPGNRDLGHFPALHAVASPDVRRRPLQRPGNDQRESERRTHLHRQRRSHSAAGGHRRLLPAAQSRDSDPQRRFGVTRRGRTRAADAPFARIRPDACVCES